MAFLLEIDMSDNTIQLKLSVDTSCLDKLEQDINTQLMDLRMKANQQDVAITELKRVMETQQQAWSQTVSELNNRTWCSQK